MAHPHEKSAALTQISSKPPGLDQRESAMDQADSHSLEIHDGAQCRLCNSGPDLKFSMAFQPIVNIWDGTILAYEALVRGTRGEPAATILEKHLHNHRYSLDQRCREKAIALASTLGLQNTSADLSVNFYPNAVYQPRQCLQRTLKVAEAVNFPLNRIIFEMTESEKVRNMQHLQDIMTEYRSHGLRIALDDFGAGHSGLSLLSTFQPDILKIDRELIREIDQRHRSRTIVRSVVQVCHDLDITVVAEGIERQQEMAALCDLGIHLMQGFFFARPAFEALPPWPTPESQLPAAS